MIAIDRILCPVDFSACSRRALEYAVALADYYDARVTALHVYADLPVASPVSSLGVDYLQPVSLVQIDRVAVAAAAERFVAEVPGHGRVDLVVREALATAPEILTQADAVDASLIVIGSHGRSAVERLLLGSVAGKVLRQARQPVVVVPPHAGAAPTLPFKHVLCAIDFSDGSLRALEYAVSLAQETDARLILLHVMETPPELREPPLAHDSDIARARALARAALLERLQAMVPSAVQSYCTVEVRVVEGKAHREILEAASLERSNLIVMGVQGRGAVDLTLFGSNTLAVVHGAPCPVLTVRE